MLDNKITLLGEKEAINALEELNANQTNKKKGAEIYTKACQIYPDYTQTVSEKSFKKYLSDLSRNPESRIVKDVGSHGYYLKSVHEEEIEEIPSEEGVLSDEPTDKKERKENEKLLYPILEDWLQSQGYRTKDTSLMKAMGRWGNPDVTGIMVDESLGASFDIEIATIEAKITHKNYRYDFFEAVSHKRFANRVYFAFAAPTNFLRENRDELRYYSELYGVGVVVVALEDAHFQEYTKGQLKEIDMDLVDVSEVLSATFEPRLRRWQKNFLEQLGISNTKELWSWGNAC